jgi:hypothetical protein
MMKKRLTSARKRFMFGKKRISSIVLSITLFSMAASPISLTLIGKKQLTHDVYELEYASEHPLPLLP